MAKKKLTTRKSSKKSVSSRGAVRHGKARFIEPRTLFFLLLLLAGIIVTVIASVQSTRPFNFAACNDSGCANVKNGSY